MSIARVNGPDLYHEEHGSGEPLVLLEVDYDWSAEAEALELPVMLVSADADRVRPDHIVEFYRLLGGGLRDAG